MGNLGVTEIGDANAVVGEVKTDSTFYAVSGGRKTGSGTKTLSAASETVDAGYYAATTLSAVDADLATGNIKQGATIFGFAGTVTPSGTETYERYYTADLGAVTTYTPGAAGLFSCSLETEKLNIYLRTGEPVWELVNKFLLGHSAVIGDGTNLQFKNEEGVAREFVVMRHYISTGTYERYYTADMAVGTYTPADDGFFSLAGNIVRLRLQYKYNATWYPWNENDDSGTPRFNLLAIGDSVNLRIEETGVQEWVVLMRAIMT